MIPNSDKKITGWNSPVLIHPGEHLVDFLEETGITQTELADRIGLSKKAINEIVNGKGPITQNTAFGLSKVFSVSPEVWINLQNNYDLALARKEEEKRLEQEAEEYIPAFRETYQELAKKGFVETYTWTKRNMLIITENLQRFFSVDSLGFVSSSTMEFAFRKYNKKSLNNYTLAAWVQLGKLQAKLIETKSFDKDRLKAHLPTIKALCREDWRRYVPELEKLLAKCGVVLVLAPRLKNAPVQGATHWIESDTVLVMLNTEHQYEDRFWFSLFHELGHVLLHGKKDVYVDFDKDGEKTKEEQEADAFAQKWLVPELDEFYALLDRKQDIKSAVETVAKQHGVSPAIVAGCITHNHKATKRIYALMAPFQKERIEYSNITFNNQ
jgi:HTH-type transcriptional regulator/antitoxin HigA